MFYYADIAYESIAILLILFGKSKGGIMIALWQVIYILFCYSPNVFRVVRKPFTFRHLFKVYSNIYIVYERLSSLRCFYRISTLKTCKKVYIITKTENGMMMFFDLNLLIITKIWIYFVVIE